MADVDERVEHVEVEEPTDQSEGCIVFHLKDGRVVSAPLSWSWRLKEAEAEERQNFEISPSGYRVRWPDVDEDLTPQGLLNGGPAKRREEVAREDVAHEAWPPGRIKQLRNALEVNQKQFAEKVGVNRQATISDWETGRQKPSSMAMRVMDLLAARVWEEARKPEIKNEGVGGPGISDHHDRVVDQL